VQHSIGNQIVDPATVGERWVQADAGLWPQQAFCQVLVDAFTDSGSRIEMKLVT
jgi:hypothetical protein